MIQKFITTHKLQKIINSIPGHRFVTVVTETDYRMNKTGNPYYGNVTKRTTANVSVNFDYESAVNNRQEKETGERNFVAQERAWGGKVDNKTVSKVEANGDVKQYVALGYKSNPSSVTYFLKDTGAEVSIDDIKMYAVSKPTTAEVAAKQGVSEENAVVYRNVKMGNVKEITYNGVHYIIKNN